MTAERLKLSKKEKAVEEMEQRVLRVEHEVAQANSERDVAKTELHMRTVEKIEAEERVKSLQ